MLLVQKREFLAINGRVIADRFVSELMDLFEAGCAGALYIHRVQSTLAITDVKNKVSVIARPPKFKFVRYSKVRLAGERLEKRPVNKVSVITTL